MVVMEIPISPLLSRRQSEVSESSCKVFLREKGLFTSFHGGLGGRKNAKVVIYHIRRNIFCKDLIP